MLVAGLTVRITDFPNKSCFLHQFKGPIDGAPADPRSAASKSSHKFVGAEVAGHFADAKEHDVSGRGDGAMRMFQERHELHPGGPPVGAFPSPSPFSMRFCGGRCLRGIRLSPSSCLFSMFLLRLSIN